MGSWLVFSDKQAEQETDQVWTHAKTKQWQQRHCQTSSTVDKLQTSDVQTFEITGQIK